MLKCSLMYSHPGSLPAERYGTLPAREKPDPIPSSLEQIFPREAAADGETLPASMVSARNVQRTACSGPFLQRAAVSLNKKHGQVEHFPLPQASVPSFVDSNFKPPLPPSRVWIHLEPFLLTYLFRNSVVFILSSVLLQHRGLEPRPSSGKHSTAKAQPKALETLDPQTPSCLFPQAPSHHGSSLRQCKDPAQEGKNVTFPESPKSLCPLLHLLC